MDYRQANLFTKLRRLFSTDVYIVNKGGRELKILDTSKVQQTGALINNSMSDRYNRLYSNSPTSMWGQQYSYNYKTLRPQLYSEYDVMDTDAIVHSVLDIVADESTLKNDMDEIIQIKSRDEEVQQALYNLFYDILNIEYNLWSWVRQMCKYGDHFLKLEIQDGLGVYNVIPFSAYQIDREEGYGDSEGRNIPFIKFLYYPQGMQSYSSGMYQAVNADSTDDTNRLIFENYEMAHFRLISDVNYLPYGLSYLEAGRKLYKQYSLAEDAALIHRIMRSAEKRIFYINVGSIAPNEVDAYMEKVITNMKREPYIDSNTGEYNLKFNMMNLLEDFFLPVRGNDTTTKIDTTKGLEFDGMKDVEYFRDKLFAALKVPKAFMGYDENTDGKATLAAMDIRFARTIDRIQRIVISEFYKIALVHLYAQGFRGAKLASFTLKMNTPSIIYDQERVALMKEKVDLAQQMKDSKLFPMDYIYDNLFHMSEDQYDEMRDLIIEDNRFQFRLDQIEREGNDPNQSGMAYGTPTVLASLYNTKRNGGGKVPDGYWDGSEESKMGRPIKNISNRNTQDDAFGRDRLGVDGTKDDYNNPQDKIRYKPKGGSPMSLSEEDKVMLEQLGKALGTKQSINESESTD